MFCNGEGCETAFPLLWEDTWLWLELPGSSLADFCHFSGAGAAWPTHPEPSQSSLGACCWLQHCRVSVPLLPGAKVAQGVQIPLYCSEKLCHLCVITPQQGKGSQRIIYSAGETSGVPQCCWLGSCRSSNSEERREGGRGRATPEGWRERS